MIGANVIEHLYVLKYIQAEAYSEKQKQLQQGIPHTSGCHLGVKPGISPDAKDQFISPHPPTSKMFLFLNNSILRLLVMEYSAYKVVKKSAPAPVWL